MTQTRSHDAQNEITSISGATTPTYDPDGNLTGDETGRQFVYDPWNRLVTVKDSGGSTISSYQYDGLGRRISETKSGTTTDLYVSSADQVLEERVSGTATAQYVWSPVYVDALVLRDRDSDANGSLDERRWVQQDANWNVTALLDNSGAVVERYAYDPYGNFTIYDASWTSRSSSSYGWVYQHQGLRYDGGAGLYHARARDLSPSLGRWLQNDPAGFGAGDVDLYRAYGNGPTGALDPGGMDADFKFGWFHGPGTGDLKHMWDSFYGTIKGQIVPAALDFNANFWKGVEMQREDPIGSTLKMLDIVKDEANKLAGNYDRFNDRFAQGIVNLLDDPAVAWQNSNLRKGICQYGKDPAGYSGKAAAYLAALILAQFGFEAAAAELGAILESGAGAEAAAYPSIATPYGPANQSMTEAALAARPRVQAGATIYRIGTIGRSGAGEAQFWALEPPTSPGYAAKYGVPPQNITNADFIESGTLKPDTPFVTRRAPGVGANAGGGVEVVVPEGGVKLKTFVTIGGK